MTNDPCQHCGFSPSKTETVLLRAFLNTPLISGNKIKANGKGFGGYEYRKAKTKYKKSLNVHACERASPASLKRRVYVTRLYKKPKRAYDYDNLVWGCKPLIDVIRTNGWLFDDNPKHVEVIYNQVESDSNAIELTIAELS